MQYKITLAGAQDDVGRINIKHLETLSKCLREIEHKSLNLILYGTSTPGKKVKKAMLKAPDIFMNNIEIGSTVLVYECESFGALNKNIQLSLYDPEQQDILLQSTPFGLISDSLLAAMNFNPQENSDSLTLLDKPLLVSIGRLSEVYSDDNETLSISNGSDIKLLELKQRDALQIKNLAKQTPPSARITIVGEVDVVKGSSPQIGLIVKSEKIRVLLDETLLSVAHSYFRKVVKIVGVAHYKPNGKVMTIEAQKIELAAPKDEYFSYVPHKESALKQIKKTSENTFAPIFGTWDGDDDLLEALAELS